MSRKDYLIISAVLRFTNASDETINAMADALAKDNPLFDRIRFVKACHA